MSETSPNRRNGVKPRIRIELDLARMIATVIPDPVMQAQPDFGPAHIRSEDDLFPGKAVELIHFVENGYQASELFAVEAVGRRIGLHNQLEEDPERVVLAEAAGIDAAGVPVLGGDIRDYYMADLGLRPYCDDEGHPLRWNTELYLFDPEL